MTPPQMLVLSLFPGIDLLGRGFEEEGFTVVRGPDRLFGGAIEDFHPPRGRFEGVMGGSPCQDFSAARRCEPTGDGLRLLGEFARCVADASPEWFLLENVVGIPDLWIDGFQTQRFNLNARDVGMSQHRLRTFQFGSRDGVGLVIARSVTPPRSVTPCCMASEGSRPGRRSWADFCAAQGLPRDFDLPGFTLSAKYRAVGNGVPVPLARAVAIAIGRRHVTAGVRVCVCNCGRPVEGKQHAATAACRKRLERRRRDSAGVSGPGCVTPAASHPLIHSSSSPSRI